MKWLATQWQVLDNTVVGLLFTFLVIACGQKHLPDPDIVRSKTNYLAHRQQILDLVSTRQTKNAQILADSFIRQFGQAEDSISGFYNGLYGWLYWEAGNYRAAIPPLERAASLFEKYGPEAKLNGVYNNLGISYGQLGDHEKAVQNYQAALRLNERNTDSVELIKNHKNLALAFLNLGDLQNAERHNRLGKGFQLESNGTFELQEAEIALAGGKPMLALRIVRQLKRAQPDFFEPDNHEKAPSNLLSLGEILLAAGEPDEALSCLKKSLALLPEDTTISDWERTKTYCLMGNAYLKKASPDLALANFQSALRASVPSFRPVDQLENPVADSLPPEVWAMEALCGKTSALEIISLKKEHSLSKKQMVSHVSAALESATCAIYLIQKLKNSFVEDDSRLWLGEYTFKNFYEKPLALALRLANLTGDKSVLESAFLFSSKSKAGVLRAALEEKKQLLNAGISADSMRLSRELRLTAAAIQNRLKSAPSDSLRAALFQAKRQIDQFRHSLRLPPIHPTDADNFSLKQIQNWLPDSSVLVEYFLGEQVLYVFSVSKNQFKVEEKPLPADFDALTEGYRRSVSDWRWIADSTSFAEKIYLQCSVRLFDLLLKDALAAHPRASRLFVVPDKKLARLPFAALLTQPYSGSWEDVDLPVLIKQMAVSYRFSSAIPAFDQTGNRPSPRYGFGGFGADYRDDLSLSSLQKSKDPVAKNLLLGLRGGPDTLDFADDEVDSIAQLTGGQKWINAQATKSNFLKNVADCRILHLSLHTVETDPQDPTGLAILFSKMSETDASLLTSSELYSLDLNTELAVVSSCQSGFGQFKQGEGTLSLGRAMALAGCQSTVVNLWKADDRASRDLMISFYKNLKAGQTKDRALQNALLYYLKNTISERASPQFWANFAAIGEMDALVFEEEKTTDWRWWLGAALILGLLFLTIRFLIRKSRKDKRTKNP